LKTTKITERIIIENERKIIERVTEVIEKKSIEVVSIVGIFWGILKYYFN